MMDQLRYTNASIVSVYRGTMDTIDPDKNEPAVCIEVGDAVLLTLTSEDARYLARQIRDTAYAVDAEAQP